MTVTLILKDGRIFISTLNWRFFSLLDFLNKNDHFCLSAYKSLRVNLSSLAVPFYLTLALNHWNDGEELKNDRLNPNSTSLVLEKEMQEL